MSIQHNHIEFPSHLYLIALNPPLVQPPILHRFGAVNNLCFLPLGQHPACPPRWMGRASFAHLTSYCRAIPCTRRVSSSLQFESLALLPDTDPALNPLKSSCCTPYPNTHTTPQKNKKKQHHIPKMQQFPPQCTNHYPHILPSIWASPA